MKKYLLDTHILLWAIYDLKKLSPKTFEILEDKSNKIYISLASIWEIFIKTKKGTLKLNTDILEEIKILGIEILPIKIEHICLTDTLPLIHNDPFDRLLISQSIYENLNLITSDKKLIDYKIDYLFN
jgi:PIN domain nuclease of toxin-antitoxin system